MPDTPPRRGLPVARVLAEFITIVVGVLVALAVSQWDQRRGDRALERGYVDRLIAEVESDTARFVFILRNIDNKEASLLRLAEALRGAGQPVPDTLALLGDIATATNFAWNVGPLAGTATYADLLGSGSLGLLTDEAVRIALGEYYRDAEATDRRIEARRTEFPDVSYTLFRRSSEVNELYPDEGISHQDLAQILGRIRESKLSSHIDAEFNRARFIRNQVTRLRAVAGALLDDLAGYAESF